MAIQKKQIIVNVYDVAGNFLKTWTDFSFHGYTKELNAGLGECVITLGKLFDYSESELDLGNEVEIRISDKDTLTNIELAGAVTIYRGYISLIERSIIGGKDEIVVHLLGHYTKLAMDYLKNSAQTTLYSYASGLTVTAGSMAACDVGLLMRAVLDRYIAETVNPKISYDAADIPDTGTDVTFAFEQKTYREAMEKIKEVAPEGVYWYVDVNGMVRFKSFSTTVPTHRFVFGRHFNSVTVEQSLEKVRNSFLIWDGVTTYKHYQDDASIAKYGRRSVAISEYGSGADDAIDAKGAKLLAENKQPEVKVICTILDNNDSDNMGYDIESIQPGDTCSFYGFDPTLEIFRDNMLITRVTYELDSVEIEVQVVKSGILDVQNKQGQTISDIQSGGLDVPESYT